MNNQFLDDKFFSRLETLSFNLKSNLTGYFGGKHLVTTHGQTVEFADYREYQLGDDIRRIDWNLYSRFEKHFVKLFTDERQMQVQIFLDCSASMGRENAKKGAYAVATAAALGFLAVHNMDKVNFKLMRGTKAENPFGTIVGKNAFFTAVGSLDNIVFDGETALDECIVTSTDTGNKNGLTVIISDFFTDSDWKKAVEFLLYKNRQVLLVQTLATEELDPLYDGRVQLIDAEAPDLTDGRNLKLKITRGMQKAYEETMHAFIKDIDDFCSKRDVGFISVSTDSPIEKALFGELFRTGIMS